MSAEEDVVMSPLGERRNNINIRQLAGNNPQKVGNAEQAFAEQ